MNIEQDGSVTQLVYKPITRRLQVGDVISPRSHASAFLKPGDLLVIMEDVFEEDEFKGTVFKGYKYKILNGERAGTDGEIYVHSSFRQRYGHARLETVWH